MKKLGYRFIAYLIDMMVVLLIVQSLSGIPAINKQLSTYTKYYDEYTKLVSVYTGFKTNLSNDFKDKKLTLEECEELINDYPDYQDVLEKYYQDESLTEKNYDKLVEEIDKDYSKQYQKLYYMIEKNSSFYMIVYIIVVMLYFVLFNRVTDGQTLGKKLVRLKIVNNTNENQKVPLWSYVVRACFLYQPIYYLIRIIGVYSLSQGNYYTLTSIIYDLQYYLEIIIIAMVIIRTDGRGLHDLVARTRVSLYNKEGEEIEKDNNPRKMKKLITKEKKEESSENN